MSDIWVVVGHHGPAQPVWYATEAECAAACDRAERALFEADTAEVTARVVLRGRRQAEIAFLRGKLGKQPLLPYVGAPFMTWTSFEEWQSGRTLHAPARFEVAGEPDQVVFVVVSQRSGAVFTGRGAREAFLDREDAERAMLLLAQPSEEHYRKALSASAKKFRHSQRKQQRLHEEWELLVGAGIEPSFEEPAVDAVHEFPTYEQWLEAWRLTSHGYQGDPLQVAGLTVTAFYRAEEAAA